MYILLFCDFCSKDLERKVDWQGISDAPTTCENKVQVTAWCKALLEEKKKTLSHNVLKASQMVRVISESLF